MRRLFFVFVVMVTASVHAQVALKGKITDSENQLPVTGVHVAVQHTFTGAYTDADGIFLLKLPQADSVVLLLSHISYNDKKQSILLNASDMQVDFALEKKSILADEVIVASVRADKSVPTTFTEVDKEAIAKQNLGQDIAYLLDQTPSIVTTSDAGAGVGYTSMRIRGSDQTRINVTVNGIPINDAESQTVFYVNMPDFASSVDNIQIQRGVGTSTNGASAFGATVDMQTSKLNDSAYAEISNSYGSFNTWKNTIKLGTGLIKDKFAFDGRLSHISSDGYIDRASSKLLSYYLSGGYYGKTTILKFINFSGKEKTYQAWWGVPQDSLDVNRTYNYYNYPNETDNYRQDHYQLMLSQQLAKKLMLNLAGHYTRGKGYYEQYKGPEYNNDFGFNGKESFADYGLDDVIIGDDTITETSLIRRRQLDNHFYGLTYSFKYDNLKKFNATLGGGWNTYDGKHYGEIIWAEYASNGAPGHHFYDGTGLKKDLNVYVKANYTPIKKLNLFADLQYRNVRYTIDGTDIGFVPLNENETFHFFNPKAGASFNINSRNSVYASFAIGNREPVRSDFIDNPDNKNPKHETLRNLEAGYRFTVSKFTLNANYYLMHYKNQLVLTGELNDVGAAIRTNVPVSYRTGIELQTNWQIIKKLSWQLNFTYSANKIKQFTEVLYVYDENYNFIETEQVIHNNTAISFSPDYIGSSVISYIPVKNFELAFISKYVGKQYLDNTENEDRKLDAYFVNHFRLQYSLLPSSFKSKGKFPFKEIRFQLLLNNIFNTLYENNGYTFSEVYLNPDNSKSRVDYNYYYPQAGFNFFFGIGLFF
jgi:iron complex outermembrane receptor protein